MEEILSINIERNGKTTITFKTSKAWENVVKNNFKTEHNSSNTDDRIAMPQTWAKGQKFNFSDTLWRKIQEVYGNWAWDGSFFGNSQKYSFNPVVLMLDGISDGITITSNEIHSREVLEQSAHLFATRYKEIANTLLKPVSIKLTLQVVE